MHYDAMQNMKAAGLRCYHTSILNELRAGSFHGMRKDQIKEAYPEEFEKRQRDKLNYRYPGVGGESYLDIIEVCALLEGFEKRTQCCVV